MVKLNQKNAPFILLFAPLFWGLAFSFQSMATEVMPPFSFNAIRMFIGFLILSPVCIVSIRKNGKAYLKKLLKNGAICGTALSVATSFQHVGISCTTVGKAGFITSLYILFVPLIAVFKGRKIPKIIWPCIAVALTGAFLLCINGEGGVSRGDYLVLISSGFFAIHITLLGTFGEGISGIDFAAIQFLTISILETVFSIVFGEKTTVPMLKDALIPILYSGLVSAGLAYTIQISCQKYVPPTNAAFILSLESAIAAIGGAVILGERMNLKQIAGCVLVFTAVLLSQLDFGKKA